MIVACEDVLDAEANKPVQPDWARGAQIDRDSRRSPAEKVLATTIRRADRRDRLVMLAEQIGPIFSKLEMARRDRTMQVALEPRFEADAHILDRDAAGPAR